MFGIITPRFTTELWTIRELVDLYKAQRINLSPHYQRNSIWSLANQKSLIATIQAGNPIPNFFVRSLPHNKLEMVDGQQRSRSILGYCKGDFPDQKGFILSSAALSDLSNTKALESFMDYQLSVTLLGQKFTDKEVEEFYVLVNSSGMKLNRPELFKAEYYSTKFLKLATEMAGAPVFETLSVFSDRSAERMNDIDFVSELLAFLEFGISDKKEKVDALYKTDISDVQYKNLKQRTETVLQRIAKLNEIIPLNKTRFKQKGDFYTLFAFVENTMALPVNVLENAYRIFLRLAPHIRPSQEDCDPLMEYAVNCVTQSNSKKARETRNKLFTELFLNVEIEPNKTQTDIADYLGLTIDDYERVDSFLTYRLAALEVQS
jgi:hypothetical protein